MQQSIRSRINIVFLYIARIWKKKRANVELRIRNYIPIPYSNDSKCVQIVYSYWIQYIKSKHTCYSLTAVNSIQFKSNPKLHI